MLQMLKIDLGITSNAYDTRLEQYLATAQKEISREGITLPETLAVEDMQLIVTYAAWMWRRRDTGDGMPRMLRYLLNQRIFAKGTNNG